MTSVLTVLLIALPRAIRERGIALVAAAGFLAWLFTNVIVWNYGLFDGNVIEWDALAYRGYIELAVIAAVIAAALLRPVQIRVLAVPFAAALLIIQSLALGIRVHNNPVIEQQFHRLGFDAVHKYDFSEKKNVIVLVIDSFQGDFFQEILATDSGAAEAFDGFTYFRNAVGGYPVTAFSVPLILTGKYFDNSVPRDVFLRESYLSDTSVPRILKTHGFQVDMYPPISFFYADEETCSNWGAKIPKRSPSRALFNGDVMHDISQLLDVELFRIGPHFLRYRIYNNREWLLRNVSAVFFPVASCSSSPEQEDRPPPPALFPEKSLKDDFVRLINDMDFYVSASAEQPTFKYYHVMGLHPPLVIDETLSYHDKEMGNNRESYVRNARGRIALAALMLDELRKNDLYDNSLIFIIADHGRGNIPVRTDLCGRPLESSDTSRIHPGIISNALPLILVKPFAAHGTLTVSDAPVSLANIGPTILDALGIPLSDLRSASLFAIPDNAAVTRHFFDHPWGARDQKSAFLPRMTEYEITGFSWFAESWHKKQTIRRSRWDE